VSEELRIVPLPDGAFGLHLTRQERRVLRELPGQLRELLEEDGPSLSRLFPPAYPEDPDREADYRRMVHDELLKGRRAALEVMEASIDARRLDREELTAWLGALNDLRLVLGTRLEVTEDDEGSLLPDDDPRAPTMALYHYLGWLVAQAVEALAEGADAPG
jgi:Domain of unknown function (DUF2017)